MSTDPAGAALLSARGRHKSFGDNHVLRGVDLEVQPGSVTVLIGPSGSGKTTVLRSLNALEVPKTGVVCIGDVMVDDAARRRPAAGTAGRRAGWCSRGTTCSRT